MEIASRLAGAGFEILLDERDQRPGVKFKDADLIGVPYRITVGSKKFTEGKVELLARGTKPKQSNEPTFSNSSQFWFSSAFSALNLITLLSARIVR
jgi:prolyl-tRNA synthetase